MPVLQPVDNQQEEQRSEQQKRENEIAAMWLLTATGQKHPEAFIETKAESGRERPHIENAENASFKATT